MPFDTRQHGGPDPALAPAVAVHGPRHARPLVAGVDRKVAVLALAVAVALVAGLAWNLVQTQNQARDSLDDAIQRRAGLTADVIASAFVNSRPAAAARKEFGGDPEELRRAVQKANGTRGAQRVTVLDAGGRVLASAGRGEDPSPTARADVALALSGKASLSDAFPYGRGGKLVELAVPFPSPSGRRVLLVASPISVVEGFTRGFFATPSAFRATEGYLIDGSGRTLSATRRGARVHGPVLAAVRRGEVGKRGKRTYVSGSVPSSRWRVVLSVPNSALYKSVDGATAKAAWLLFGAFVAAIVALLVLGLLAARGARRLAAANRIADAASELAHERLHDPLTGLANRALFAARAEQAVIAARRRGRWVAVVFMDIDHYKLINDSLGHEVGDEVLRESPGAWPAACAAPTRSAASAATSSWSCATTSPTGPPRSPPSSASGPVCRARWTSASAQCRCRSRSVWRSAAATPTARPATCLRTRTRPCTGRRSSAATGSRSSTPICSGTP
jgi:hypothetical protein